MKKNVGSIDKIVRFVLGIGFIVLSFVVSPWFVIGAVIALGTALLGFCPLYLPFGINTNKTKK
jgi:hypothetical protein